jgi:hypothetical protein
MTARTRELMSPVLTSVLPPLPPVAVIVPPEIEMLATEDLSSYGVNVLVRSQSRGFLWLSKCLWIITTVLAFYGIGVIVALAFGIVFGDPFQLPDAQAVSLISNIDIAGVDIGDILLVLGIAPAVSGTAGQPRCPWMQQHSTIPKVLARRCSMHFLKID